VTGSWDEYYDNRLEANQHVKPGQWPEAARRVIENSGIEKSAGAVAYAPTR
jgi:hypothetical protein